jgi:hypothetical protein
MNRADATDQMKRCLTNFAVFLAPCICVAVAALWIISYYQSAWLNHARKDSTQSFQVAGFTSVDGSISLSRATMSARLWTAFDGRQGLNYGAGTFYRRYVAMAYTQRQKVAAPFFLQHASQINYSQTVFTIRYWFLTALALIPAVFSARYMVQQHQLAKRKSAHLCPTCGYDLRATPDRCPECGTRRAQLKV